MSRRGLLKRTLAAGLAWLTDALARVFARERPLPPGAHEVIVIGGGFAGMAAATWLAENDYDVLVLERERSVGGRARFDVHQGWRFPLGTEYIGLPEESVRWLFEQARLEPLPIPEPAGAYWHDGKLIRSARELAAFLGPGANEAITRLARRLAPLARAIERNPWEIRSKDALAADRQSLADLLTEARCPEPLARLLDGQMRGIFGAGSDELCALYAAPEALFELPSLEPEEDDEEPDPEDRIYTLPQTLGELPRALAARLGERVRTATAAETIAWDAESETFVLEAGRETRRTRFRARALVLAVPAPIALGLAGDLLTKTLREALARVRYASYLTVHLFSRRPLMRVAWDLSCLGTVFTDLYDATRIEAAARGVEDDQRPGILSAYLPEPRASNHTWLTLEDAALLERVITDLERVLGKTIRSEITGHRIERFIHAFPVFTPNYYGHVLSKLNRPSALPLYLAGDFACYPTVEGAVASAERAVSQLDDAW